MREWSVLKHMAQEHLPLDLEGVLLGYRGRHCLPASSKINWIRNIRIPHGLRRPYARLHLALTQPCDCTALRTIDVQLQKFGAIYACYPGRIDVRNRTALKLEGRICGIVCSTRIGLA